MPKTNQNKDGCNKKLKLVVLRQVNVISLLLLQILPAIENCQYSRIRILHMNCPILVNILNKIDRFVIGPFETSLWSRHLYFLKNKQRINACVVSNFYPGLEKISIIRQIWNFHPGLKFHLGLTQLQCYFLKEV